VTGAIFAEYVGATAGLGIFMALQKNSFRTDLVLAAVVITALLSVTLFGLTYVAQRLLVPWYAKEGRG
jgi:ABC-type nitrate/sulfonate/bicarbonate transport system permease component